MGQPRVFPLMAVSYCSDIISYLARNTCHLKVHAVMCLYSTSGWLHPDPCSAWNCETLLLQSPGLNPDGMPASFFWQRWVFLLLMQWQPHCRALKRVLPSPASFWSTESWKNEKVQTVEDKLGATAAGRKEVYACIRGFSKVKDNEP